MKRRFVDAAGEAVTVSSAGPGGPHVAGDRARFDVFAKVPWYPFPGGRMFRVPYSMMGSWYYALRDRLGV